MGQLSHHEIVQLLLSLAVLLGAARILGELARRLRQPAVIGELLAGVMLGPTVLGKLWPAANATLFPTEGAVSVAMHGFTVIAITLFLLVAGMEVDLSTIWKRRIAAFSVGIGGMVVPFVMAFAVAWFAPSLLGAKSESPTLVFALFIGTAMAISALPVVAKMLMDLQLFRTDVGMTIIAAAVFNDLAGWMIFAVVLAMIGQASSSGLEVWQSILVTVLFVVFMLTIARWLLDRVLPWIQAHLSWPGGMLGFSLVMGILCAAFTEWIGVHAVFGAFMFGVALGDSRHLRASTRETIDQFISFIFAPLFFASVGLRVNFFEHFDLGLVLIVLALATVGKLLGCVLSARMARFPRREAWAIGFGMNARGAMEIILGLLAFEAGIIDARLFVALVIMALVTSMTSGSLMQWVMGRTEQVRFWAFAGPKLFVPRLDSTDRFDAIRELARVVGGESRIDAIAGSAVSRERLLGSGIGGGVAVPHARLEDITEPIVAVGISRVGIDFDARDGHPARIIILLVTPASDARVQLQLLASVAAVCRDAQTVERLALVGSWTEFLAVLNVDAAAARST
ncbi:MAG: cation:proton antiporter [Phycisphaeraceae bacterium]|nr:cation:proton antiporter [Phycisphaeraceae bacterium]